MKYILMMTGPKRVGTPHALGRKKDIQAHIAFMMNLNKKLTAAGELVSAEGLASPTEAKVVRAGKDGRAHHRRRLPGIQGISRRLLDRRRREPRTCLCNRRPRVGRTGPRRGTHEHADRSAAGDERAARRIPVTPRTRSDTSSICCANSRPGARCDHPPLPRLRRRGGRRAGGAGRRRRAMAAGGPSGQSARLADPGRLPPHDRSDAQRSGPPAPRNRRGHGVGTAGAAAGAETIRSRTTRSSCSSCAAIPR